ncbi:phosphonate ABC transporter, permease protein PhnE [Natroniella sulfidigena]|uniref:phosphonate ABC transporter, permease protein PhnE n=1 Tax=Natroniella sulfidigena TaxID=723921 RepID=UPI00200A96CA|nr:phosphonate ABC transporter, permease protein PhnE [Natroniella sulfidigena]MCK8816107.1 phosphonate ABC transporter, permease protein PhnE [Natroniella sulfidigena]
MKITNQLGKQLKKKVGFKEMDLENKKVKTVLIISLIAIVHLWSLRGVGFDLRRLLKIGNTIEFIATRWFPPDWSILNKVLGEAIITLQIAIVGTSFSLLVALPLSFLAAKNTTPWEGIYSLVRGFLSFLRSVPEIVFALVLIPALGLGPFAGALALIFHNIGVLGKLISEKIEAADKGSQEAILSVGASNLSVITFGILPQIMPDILSETFYRFEVNIRASLILGLIGAGGIGQLLFIHFRIFAYQKVLVDTLIILIMVIGIDYISSLIRTKVI